LPYNKDKFFLNYIYIYIYWIPQVCYTQNNNKEENVYEGHSLFPQQLQTPLFTTLVQPTTTMKTKLCVCFTPELLILLGRVKLTNNTIVVKIVGSQLNVQQQQ
jgi:hypothetical protein